MRGFELSSSQTITSNRIKINDSSPSSSMSSINDSLAPDLLFRIFKRLDCIETTIVRRVCKKWLDIIDKHKSFWRTLHLREDCISWDPSILELFDEKSGSGIRDVDVEVDVSREFQERCFNTLKKSRETLKHLYVKVSSDEVNPDLDCLDAYPNLESLIVFYWHRSCNILLKRSDTSSIQDEDAASPLRVLWYNSYGTILRTDPSRFRHLVTLDAGEQLSASEWRGFLEGPSRTLKHLRIGFLDSDEENHEEIFSLSFPKLEVLELESDGAYPQWMKIKPSVKLICHGSVSNFPSISELWITQPRIEDLDLVDRCPELKTLRIHELWEVTKSVVRMLVQRSEDVEAGAMVDGVQMKKIQTLAVPMMENEFVEQLRGLAENLVDVEDLPKVLEVEI